MRNSPLKVQANFRFRKVLPNHVEEFLNKQSLKIGRRSRSVVVAKVYEKMISL